MKKILWNRFILLFIVVFQHTLTVMAQQDSIRFSYGKDSIRPYPVSLSLSPDIKPDEHGQVVHSPVIPTHLKVIEGVVRDITTQEALSFASIGFVGTAVGTKADVDGKFRFEFDRFPSDSLRISIIGYAKKTIWINTKPNYQSLRIEMERSNIQIRDFVLSVSRDPALALVRKVIRNKAMNNYDKAENYSYEVYNKLEMDINKIPPKAFQQSPILKTFDFVKDFIDSSSEDKPFLPLFLTETISDYYYQSRPKKMKEFIKGSRISGYKNQSVSQLLGGMYQNINVYQNLIPIFNVDFVSPIANDAPFFYTYQLMDTQLIAGKTCYHVAFIPKRSGEHTFNGDMWIHDTDYAVQKMNMIVTREQNINWVRKVTMLQEFTCFQDTLWFLTKDKFYVDFLPPHGEKVAGFLGRKTATYKNIRVNDPSVSALLNDKKNKAETEMDQAALTRDENYWNSVRHDSLTKNEKAIYRMIDTIQGLPVYKRYYALFYLLGTGIKELGPLEIGPVYNLVSRNPVEGTRFRLTLGTTPRLFKNIYLQAYLAYGLNDERFKYYGSALWLLKRNPRMYVYAEYKHDLDNSNNQYDASGSFDNVFSRIGRKKGVPWKLAFVDKQRLEFFNSHFNGFSYLLSAERRQFTPYDPLPANGIFYTSDSSSSSSVGSNELGLEIRYAHREQFVEGNYYRTSLGTKYPRVKAYIGQGLITPFGGNYRYTKLRISVSDDQPIPHFGSLYYNVFAGKTYGTLPYSLLEIHPGNEFYYYNSRAFNMMYRYEYISDRYAGLILEHSLGSLFFKYIPCVKKMKVRTFWNAKGVYGGLTLANRELNMNRGYNFQTLTRSPYLELGTGVENILKVLRVDFIWRVLPTPRATESDARRFGIFGSVKFAF